MQSSDWTNTKTVNSLTAEYPMRVVKQQIFLRRMGFMLFIQS